MAHRQQTMETLERVVAFGLIYVIWGSTYLAIRYVVASLPPFLSAGARFVVAGSLLYAWILSRGAPRPRSVHWRSTAIVGGLLLLGGNGGVVWAEQIVPSGITALLIATVPLWMVLLHWLSPGGARPTGRVVAGLVIGFAGLVMLVNPFASGDTFRVDPVGAGVLVMATIFWSAGSIYSRSAPMPASGLQATAMEMLCGGGLLLLAGTVTGEWGRLDLASVAPAAWIGLAYLVVFGSLIAFSAYIWLLKHVHPAKVATYAYVNPVIAVLLGWLVAGEPLNGHIIVAASVIITAVVIITTGRAEGRLS